MSRRAHLTGFFGLLTLLATGAGLPAQEPAPPPIVGQHSRKILQELGYEIEQINALHSEGIIQTLS